MTPQDIYHFVYHDQQLQPFFLGLFGSDQLNFSVVVEKVKKFGFLVNTNNSKNLGKHWQSVFVDKENDTVYFFCPYGENPNYQVFDYLMKFKKGHRNRKPVASDCPRPSGIYCLLMLRCLAMGLDFGSFCNDMETKDPEIFVQQYMQIILQNKAQLYLQEIQALEKAIQPTSTPSTSPKSTSDWLP